MNADDTVPAPPLRPSRLRRLQEALLGTWADRIITLACIAFAIAVVPPLIEWAFINAVWSVDDAEQCTPERGACWAVVQARFRLILFGLYPYDEHWRSALASGTIVLVTVISCMPRAWTGRRLAILWASGFVVFYLLMRGGAAGLTAVTPDRWGGLALTLFIFSAVVLIGFPLSIVLALARRSKLPVIARLAAFAIDLTRSFPLLTILFAAAVILPFALPDWLQGDKLYRVVLAFAFFFACYQAEIVRGGLQAIAAGQEEAAKSLGLSYPQTMALVMLPQAFRNALPATINQIVITFKETSVVVIIGFFEVMASGNAAFGSGEWTHAYVEVYVFVALIYFVFVFSLSKYGAYLERRMSTGL
ncbi:MAG: ABC transporter permease subunit [Gammaproteobacteria bacterium]|nr:ABC transporter permease subunit [Gammaproteobacteria bacterium]